MLYEIPVRKIKLDEVDLAILEVYDSVGSDEYPITPSIRELGVAVERTHSNVAVRVQRLVEAGLLRQIAPTMSRAILITGRGQERLREADGNDRTDPGSPEPAA